MYWASGVIRPQDERTTAKIDAAITKQSIPHLLPLIRPYHPSARPSGGKRFVRRCPTTWRFRQRFSLRSHNCHSLVGSALVVPFRCLLYTPFRLATAMPAATTRLRCCSPLLRGQLDVWEGDNQNGPKDCKDDEKAADQPYKEH